MSEPPLTVRPSGLVRRWSGRWGSPKAGHRHVREVAILVMTRAHLCAPW